MAGKPTGAVRGKRIYKSMTNDPVILRWLSGYRLPFITKVKQVVTPKQRSFSLKERTGYTSIISEMETKGVVSKCEPVVGHNI